VKTTWRCIEQKHSEQALSPSYQQGCELNRGGRFAINQSFRNDLDVIEFLDKFRKSYKRRWDSRAHKLDECADIFISARSSDISERRIRERRPDIKISTPDTPNIAS